MNKSKSKQPARRIAAKEFSISEAMDLIASLPEIAEAYSRADIELALDDRGWLAATSSNGQTSDDLDPLTRRSLILKSRLYWQRDPLFKQAVRLWTDYSLGAGITYNSDETATMTELNKWFKDRRNRRLLRSSGQRRLSSKLLIDGELFFALFEDGTLRLIDCLQVSDIIVDPDDDEHILGYRRELPNKKGMYYADWATDADERVLGEQQTGPRNEAVVFEQGVVVYHLAFDALQKRGNGLGFCCLDWTREHRKFMESRVSIAAALAKYAYKITAKGGQGALDGIRKRLESSITQDANSLERNPKTSSASTWLQNGGLDLAAMPRMTGAGDAKQDGDQFKLMIASGTGIMLHYFGDPSTGNLATATAMELPMLKMFESYQQLWLDTYRDLFSIVLKEDAEPAGIDIDLPPILARNMSELADALQKICGIFPELEQDEVLQMVLVSLGMNNVDLIMEKVRDKREANAAAAISSSIVPAVSAPVPPGKKAPKGSKTPVLTPTPGTPSTEAFRELAAALRSVSESLNPAL